MTTHLTEHEMQFILHWGEMANKWGVNRTVAQIHALLFIKEDALTAESICEYLSIARSNASNSIKELERLNLIKRIHKFNDRCDYFETYGDVWELFRIIAKERIEQELKPTQTMLTNLLDDPKFRAESPIFQKRTKETVELINSIVTLGDELLSISTGSMKRLLKAGSGLSKFILNFSKKN